MEPAFLDAAIARVLAGDREAYRIVVERTEPAMRLVAAAILPEASLVEDVVQEAYVTAYGKLRSYRPGSDPVAWLKAIVRNLALNARRGWLREQGHRDRSGVAIEEAICAELTVHADAAGEDLVERLRSCLDRLGGTARQVVEASYWQGREAEAIAAEHGKSAVWTRVVLHRARAALADCLGGGHGR